MLTQGGNGGINNGVAEQRALVFEVGDGLIYFIIFSHEQNLRRILAWLWVVIELR